MTQTCSVGDEAETVLGALQVMVGIADASVERVIGELTLTQFRALRIVVEQTPITLSRVAEQVGVNPSSMTRACDRLVAEDLLRKAPNPLNKRETLLAPTAHGRQIVQRVHTDRLGALTAVLDRLDPAERAGVVRAMERFATAAEFLRDANNLPESGWGGSPPS
ncbi:MarR family transcriptional regulator [Amycolatopsis granulosa]|uniref:MarR family transcriptional regulator n=1 Tax=Amycolatopsis granulosa TaxID=185684 RepID=UPI00141EC58F|nr:DNA-binding MarR family transcriptional regulator [Amycolatopsis granulosa]